MRHLKQCALIFFPVLLYVSFAHSIEVSLKLSGGLSYLGLENINRSLQDWQERHKKDTLNNSNWEFIEGGVKKFHSGIDFQGEIILSLNSHFAASIGIGYIYSELVEEDTALTIKKDSVTYIYAWPTKVNASPLTLSGYYFYPLGKKFRLFLKGGMGFIWAKFVDYAATKTLQAEKFTYSIGQRASSQGSVFLGGLGGIYEIEAGICAFIEASGRFSEISEFHNEGKTETLYYYEEYNPSIEFWQAKNRFFTELPSGENIRAAQETAINLSGYSVKVGLLIKF